MARVGRTHTSALQANEHMDGSVRLRLRESQIIITLEMCSGSGCTLVLIASSIWIVCFVRITWSQEYIHKTTMAGVAAVPRVSSHRTQSNRIQRIELWQLPPAGVFYSLPFMPYIDQWTNKTIMAGVAEVARISSNRTQPNSMCRIELWQLQPADL